MFVCTGGMGEQGMASEKFKYGVEAPQESVDSIVWPAPLVLIIDDDSNIQEALEFLLKMEGYRVIVCEDGDAGVRSISSDVDVVLLDIKMPGKDGFQVYKELKALSPRVPIIFYSAYQNIMDAPDVRQTYTPFAYLDKSGDPTTLLSTLEQAVKYSRRIQDSEETK